MGNRLCVAVSVPLFTLIALTVAWASITGSISGVVTDSSGAVISGASVVAVNTQTGVRTTVTTDAKGFYNLPTLAIGTYALEIRHIGFKTFQKNGLIIDANSSLRADAILDVGAINEKVEVSTRLGSRGNPEHANGRRDYREENGGGSVKRPQLYGLARTTARCISLHLHRHPNAGESVTARWMAD